MPPEEIRPPLISSRRTYTLLDNREGVETIKTSLEEHMLKDGFHSVDSHQGVIIYGRFPPQTPEEIVMFIQESDGLIDDDEDGVAESPCIILNIILSKHHDDSIVVDQIIRDCLEELVGDDEETPEATETAETTTYTFITPVEPEQLESEQRYCSEGLRKLIERFSYDNND